jgi:hypothetical protein
MKEFLTMVRTARFAFDDHDDIRRIPFDELDNESDDSCFEAPLSESAREPAPPCDQDEHVRSMTGDSLASPPARRSAHRRKAA